MRRPTTIQTMPTATRIEFPTPPTSPTYRSFLMRFPCPCCGYKTLPAPSPSDEICEVCFWQDDFVDNHDTDVVGPNSMTLSAARANFARWGASQQRWTDRVRAPRPEEGPPAPWTDTRSTLIGGR